MKQRILKTTGYKMIKLCSNNTQKHLSVHRIIAETFIENLNNLPEVNHKNGIKTDNRVENLEWCTKRENIQHAHRVGLIDTEKCRKRMKALGRKGKGKNNCNWKGYINVYDIDFNFIKKFETLKDIKLWLQENSNYKVSIGNICTAIKKQCIVYGYRYNYDNATGERLGGFGSTNK